MKTLAFIVITLTSPPHMENMTISTMFPVECIPNMDILLAGIKLEGYDGYGQCFYTHAPVTSARPIARTN